MKAILRGLDSFNRGCATVARLVANTCVAAMILVVFCGVVWRYFLRDPLSWVDEMAALLLVVISFLGCYLALAKKKLARIDLLLTRFHGKARTAAYVFSECVSLTMILFVVYYGTQLFFMPTSLRQKTPGMFIPLWFFYGLIPLTFLGNVVTTITHILHYIYDEPENLDREIEERGRAAT